MDECYCDYDPPSFCHSEIRKARKEHTCHECRGRILKGERYEHTRGKWECYIDTFDTCERCYDIRTWTGNNIPCLCWAYGNIIQDCWDAVEDAAWRASEETKGLRFGFLRRVVARDRLNLMRKTQ